MGDKLYIGGLPYSATNTQLQKLFAAYGIVKSAKVIMNKLTGRCRGFGFVEMSSEDEVRAAIQALNGMEFEGRTLLVDEARSSRGAAPRQFAAIDPAVTQFRQSRRKARRSIVKV